MMVKVGTNILTLPTDTRLLASQKTKDGSPTTGQEQTGTTPSGVMEPHKPSMERAARERVKARERRERKETTKVARAKAKAKARKEKARMAKETMPPML